jgi:uncharacterized protein (DUF427 family)
MSTRVRDTLSRAFGELRHEPTEKRIRAVLGGEPVVESGRALLVWEPRRIVPSYAVPVDDVRGELERDTRPPEESDSPVLHPGIPFGVHSTEGEALVIRGRGAAAAAAFRPADPELTGHVILDFDGFDAWYEEDEQIFGHPRDPYHRVDVRRSSRSIRIELDGEVLADGSGASLLFETNLPVRFYLPPEDVRSDRRPTEKRTYCPYKGQASYWSFDVNGRTRANLAWSYEAPLPDAAPVTGLIAFWDEVVDVVIDGERRERPDTPFARALAEEFGV